MTLSHFTRLVLDATCILINRQTDKLLVNGFVFVLAQDLMSPAETIQSTFPVICESFTERQANRHLLHISTLGFLDVATTEL